MTFHIGQVVPFDYRRRVFGADCDPQWFILCTAPQMELPLTAWLTRNGAHECWHPTEVAWRPSPRRDGRKVKYLRRIVPGYLFAHFDRTPNWDVMIREARGKLTRVVSRDGEPLAIPDRVIMAMAQVPESLNAIREREKAARERKKAARTIGKAARTIHVGDRATLDPGSALAWTVEITAIHQGIAHFVIPLLGGREAKAPIDRLHKLGVA